MKNKNVTAELKSFIDSCEEFKCSKLILMEKNISLILNTIAKGGTLYNIIADKIIGYNFKNDYKNFLVTKSFDYIETDRNTIPFIFCLLNEMDNGNINVFSFLKKVYGEDHKSSYENFSSDIVDRFENEIVGIVNKITSIDIDKDIEKNNDLKNNFPMFDSVFNSRIKFVADGILERISKEKIAKFPLKNEASTICFSVGVCLDREEFSGVLGLIMGLKTILDKNKKFKNDVLELNLLIDSIVKF